MLYKTNIIKLNSKFHYYKPDYFSGINIKIIPANISESKIDLAYFFDQIFFKKLKLIKKDSSEYLFQSSSKMVTFDFYIEFKNFNKLLVFFKYLWLSQLKLDKILYYNQSIEKLFLVMNSGQIYLDFIFNIFQQKNFKILIEINLDNLSNIYLAYLFNFLILSNKN